MNLTEEIKKVEDELLNHNNKIQELRDFIQALTNEAVRLTGVINFLNMKKEQVGEVLVPVVKDAESDGQALLKQAKVNPEQTAADVVAEITPPAEETQVNG